MRVLLAAILGGAVFFVWSFVAHDMLGLGEVGIKDIPSEQTVVSELRNSITQPGFYFIPGVGLPPNATSEQKKAAMQQFQQKIASGPFGILIYHPVGADVQNLSRQLPREFGLNVVVALIMAILVAWAAPSSFASRLGFVTLAGIMVALLTNVEYWNWYGFPANYTLAAMATQVIGFFLAGIVIALIVPPRSTRTSTY
jgi:hypothetical protein